MSIKIKRGHFALFRGLVVAGPVEDELEKLKQKKMRELQQRLLKQKQEPPEKPEEPSPKEVLDRYFVGRAWEVFHAAKSQFPEVMAQIENALVEAMKAGKIKRRIDGESLYHFLRKIGVPVRLQTTIRFKEHGELKTLEQKIRENQ